MIDNTYLQTLQANPHKTVDVIIRTNTNPSSQIDQVTRLGLSVTRTFSLIQAIAATGPASAVIALAAEPWVDSIEPDQSVQSTE